MLIRYGLGYGTRGSSDSQAAEHSVGTRTPKIGVLSLLSRYLRSVGISGVCTALAYPLYPHFDPVNIVMLYVLGAAIAGLSLGRGPAALAAIVNAAAFDFFFVPPRYSFYVSETQYLVTLGAMLAVSVTIAALMANIRRQTEAVADRERRTALLYSMSRDLTAAADAATISRQAERHVGAALDGWALMLIPDAAGRLVPGWERSSHEPEYERPLAERVFVQQRPHVGSDAALEGRRITYLPLACSGRALGVLIAASHRPDDGEGEPAALLEALTGQIALALERVRLADLAAAERAAAERAALRNTLLASISHDLRGPLTAIAGAGSLVAQGGQTLDRHRRQVLGCLIEDKARDMAALLGNVLELIRLESQSGVLNADWQSLEEVIGSAIRNHEHRLGRRRISSKVSPDFPPIFADSQLLVQVFANLLDNAIKHTPEGTTIVISAVERDGRAFVAVEDDGPGFGARDPELLFEKFERGQSESHLGGVGLGLAICRAIMGLHGGTIRARHGTQGGACFEMTLPFGAAREDCAAERGAGTTHLEGVR